MIRIKTDAIENFIDTVQRKGIDYYKQIADEMVIENRPLFDIIYKNAQNVVDSLDRREEDGIISETTKRFIKINLMTVAMATYKAVEIQLEANELESIYGNLEEQNENRT